MAVMDFDGGIIGAAKGAAVSTPSSMDVTDLQKLGSTGEITYTKPKPEVPSQSRQRKPKRQKKLEKSASKKFLFSATKVSEK